MKFWVHELAIEFHRMTTGLSVSSAIKDQLDRAAVSIACNLAEGNARHTPKDKLNFFQIAYGSTKECITLLRLANLEDSEVADVADRLGAGIFKLLNSNVKPTSRPKQ